MFFALYRERAGRGKMSLELPEGARVSNVIEAVRNMYPHLAPASVNIVVALNTEFADPDDQVSHGDQIALIPPVSGGSR